MPKEYLRYGLLWKTTKAQGFNVVWFSTIVRRDKFVRQLKNNPIVIDSSIKFYDKYKDEYE